MADPVSWASPLLLLPGVGLLLVSTSSRFDAVHQEIHDLLAEGTDLAQRCAAHTLRRARLLSVAMFCLYLAAAALALSGLCGAIAAWWTALHSGIAVAFLMLGVASVVVAGAVLARESLFTFDVIAAHSREIGRRR